MCEPLAGHRPPSQTGHRAPSTLPTLFGAKVRNWHRLRVEDQVMHPDIAADLFHPEPALDAELRIVAALEARQRVTLARRALERALQEEARALVRLGKATR